MSCWRSRCRSTGALLVLAAVLTLAAGACRSSSRPEDLSLATLALHQDRYQGVEVRTQGIVRRFTDPSGPYFVIEDQSQDRVELLPASRVAPFDGRRVEVVGTFDVDPSTGRAIHVQRLSTVNT